MSHSVTYLDGSVDNHAWCSSELSCLSKNKNGLGLRKKSGSNGRQEEENDSRQMCNSFLYIMTRKFMLVCWVRGGRLYLSCFGFEGVHPD
jgi:hypothetical protein